MFLTVSFFALLFLAFVVLIVYLFVKSRTKRLARRKAAETGQATRW